jgi:hypothetical protein
LVQAEAFNAPAVEVRPRTPATTLIAQAEGNIGLVLAVFTVLYAFGFWVAASHKPFWFDEIFTYQLAQLPHIGDIWRALRQGIELNPPLLFWTTWILHRIFGGGPVVTRLPAAIGYWVMTICLYHFVRRRTRPVYGLFGAFFPLFTFAGTFRLEARGYAFELGFAALALLCWQFAADGLRRRWALPGLTLSLAAAVSSHYYAAYLIGALLAAELVRAYVLRRLDYPCILAVACGALPLLAYRPLLGAVSQGAKHFWMSSPSSHVLYECYAGLVTPGLILGLPVLIYLAMYRGPVTLRDCHEDGLRPWDAAALALLALMPFAVFVAAFFVRLGFYDRYVILAAPAFAILCVCMLYQLTSGSLVVASFLLRAGVLTCLLPWSVWQAVTLLQAPLPVQAYRSKTIAPAPADKDLPVVVADENLFLEDWLYHATGRKQQFVMLIDYQAAAQYANNDTGQRSLYQGSRWWPIPAIDYHEFVSRHSEFLLARLSVHADWMAQKLIADGAELRLVEIHRDLGFLSPELQIFLVKLKSPVTR